ncbi:MAG: MTH1187 family thiamine-binding protein [Syntrophobacteraceae bacterium]|nr:MTH1187 family thiamine-binding protein [Syntrophobacteraceae bacterium]
MAIVEVSIVPIGVQGTSLSSYVAGALEVLRKSSLQYELTAMGTIITGELDEVWKVLREMHESCFQRGADRVLTQIRIDDRRDRVGTPHQKIRSVLDKLSE